MSTSHKLLFAGKLMLTVLIIALAFAVTIPNCIVPETTSHPRYFACSGVSGPTLISGIVIYCVWFWR